MSDKAYVEAVLFVSTDPVNPKEVAKKTGLGVERAEALLNHLKEEYEDRDSGIRIDSSKSGYKMTVAPGYEDQVTGFIPETDLTEAQLKTLALIAYEQPIKQSYVVKIRGNRAYNYIKQLINLELVEARKSGRTKILSTTSKFREYFKIKDSEEIARK